MDSAYQQKIITMLGDKGKKWLEDIPHLIQEYEKIWNIKVFDPFSLSYNYVAPAQRQDGTKAVLKIGLPDNKEFFSEVEALRLFSGIGAVKLLEENMSKGIILLEHVLPGRPLSNMENDEEVTKIAATVAKNLWIPAPKNNLLIPLGKWLDGFERYREKYPNNGLLSEELVNKGEQLFRQLLATTSNPMLIHGDFHHHNILSSQRDGWLAIDPKGVLGDPAYDIAVFIYNPLPEFLERPNINDLVKNRITIFSKELGIDAKRIQEWGIAQSILSSLWSLEDTGKGWENRIQFAEMLLQM